MAEEIADGKFREMREIEMKKIKIKVMKITISLCTMV